MKVFEKAKEVKELIEKAKKVKELIEKANQCAHCPFMGIKSCSIDKECDLTLEEAMKLIKKYE